MLENGIYDNVGQALRDRGWRQASLFGAAGRVYLERSEKGLWVPQFTAAHADEVLIIATQDCDIVSRSEPFVEALPCYLVDNSQQEKFNAARNGNSSRFFPLEWVESEGASSVLIADATHRMVLDKHALLEITHRLPDMGDDPDLFYRRFRGWLGGRYSRPPMDDSVVRGVQAPIMKVVSKLRRDKSINLSQSLREIRFVPVRGNPPYVLNLIILIEDGFSEFDESVATLLGGLSEAFDESTDGTRIADIQTVTAEELSVRDYEQTWKVPLDHMSWKGAELVGAPAVEGIEHG